MVTRQEIEQDLIDYINELNEESNYNHNYIPGVVYDFFYYNEKSYNKRKNIIMDYLDEEMDSILVLACGTGIFLSELEDNFERVVGMDINEDMLSRARNNCDTSEILQGDVSKDLSLINGEFDAVLLLGNALSQFSTTMVLDTMEQVYDVLSDDGLFIFDYLESNDMKYNHQFIRRSKGRKAEIRRVSNSLMKKNTQNSVDVVSHYTVYINNEKKHSFVHTLEMNSFLNNFIDHNLNDIGFKVKDNRELSGFEIKIARK